MIALRLAWRLAFARDRRQRWRQVSLLSASFLASLLALFTLASMQVAVDADQRLDARHPTFATTETDARLAMRTQGAIQPGFGQFLVVWIEPVDGAAGDLDIVPPGLRSLPGPGEAVLSPGLIEAGYTASTFGLVDSAAGTGVAGAIGDAGLGSRSEGLVYARPVAGRSLEGSPEDGSLFTGYHGGSTFPLETYPDVPSPGTMLVAVIAAGVVPAALLLFGATRSLSSLRTDRGRTLFILGLRPGQIRRVLGLETAMLALPGVFAGTVATALWLPQVEQMPFDGARTEPGSWSLPLDGLVLTSATVLVVAAVLGQTSPISRRVRRTGASKRPWLLAPLVLGFVAMSAEPWVASTSSKQLVVMVGLTLVLLGLPLGLPQLSLMVARRMDAAQSPARWLGSRLLRHHAAKLSLPAGIVGSFIIVATTGQAMLAGATTVEDSAGQAPATLWSLSWTDRQVGDLALVDQSFDGGGIVLASSPRTSELAFDNCADVNIAAGWYGVPGCVDGQLSEELAAVLQQQSGYDGGVGWGGLKEEARTLAQVITPTGTTEFEVREQLPAQLPGLFLQDSGSAPGFTDPVRPWIFLWWTVATLVTLLVMTRETAERAMRAAEQSAGLMAIGFRERESRRTFTWTLVIPMLLAVPIALTATLLFVRFAARAQLTPGLSAAILGVAVAAALLGVLASIVVIQLTHRSAPERG